MRRRVRSCVGGFVLLVAALSVSACAPWVPARPAPSADPTEYVPYAWNEQPVDGCEGLDPEERMALNRKYRERIELDPDVQAENDALIPAATEVIEGVSAAGVPPAGVLAAALATIGLYSAQTRDDPGTLLFGVQGVEVACPYSSLSAEGLVIKAGGIILDGGCLADQ